MKTVVDEYWSEHTVRSEYFKTQVDSEKYSEWRLNKYPLYKEFMELDEHHNGEVVIDYGCGPGNDLIHFMKTGAKKIIGMDISERALNLAKHQVSLYSNNVIPVEFIKTTDNTNTLSLENNSIDYIICSGVLHHVSQPLIILKEFFRILKTNSYARIMVYNRNSIFFHMYVAYERRGGIKGSDVDGVFKRSTDGADCPISKAYEPSEFIELCNSVGFKTKFVGGYLSDKDAVRYFNGCKDGLLNDSNLNDEHKKFVRAIKIDNKGYPIYNGKCCGIGGVYQLYKK